MEASTEQQPSISVNQLAGYAAKHFRYAAKNRVACITLDRAERKNPLTFESYAELRDLFRALAHAADVKAVVLTGAGFMRHRSFTIGMFTSFMLGFAMYVSVFVFPIFCQNLLGFSALQTGELLFPGGIATICMMPFVGTALKRGFPAQLLSTVGMMLFFLFSYLMANSNLLSGTENFFWPLIVRGVGMSLLFVPLTTLAVQDLHGKEMGQGTGLNNMMRQLGGSFGVAISTVILNNRIAFHQNVLSGYANQYNGPFNDRLNMMVHSFVSKGYSLLDAQHMALKAIGGQVTKQALLLSYNDVYLFVGGFMLCCIPLLYLQKFKKNVVLPADTH